MRGFKKFFITVLIALNFNSIQATLNEQFFNSLQAILNSPSLTLAMREKVLLMATKLRYSDQLGLSQEYVNFLIQNEAVIARNQSDLSIEFQQQPPVHAAAVGYAQPYAAAGGHGAPAPVQANPIDMDKRKLDQSKDYFFQRVYFTAIPTNISQKLEPMYENIDKILGSITRPKPHITILNLGDKNKQQLNSDIAQINALIQKNAQSLQPLQGSIQKDQSLKIFGAGIALTVSHLDSLTSLHNSLKSTILNNHVALDFAAHISLLPFGQQFTGDQLGKISKLTNPNAFEVPIEKLELKYGGRTLVSWKLR